MRRYMLKLVLGSVQFGLAYGISNQSARAVPNEEVAKIIEYAHAHEINCIDTAATYGKSEVVIGETIRHRDFKLITKTPPFFKDSVITESHLQAIRNAFQDSLQRLKRNKIYGLMVHHADDLLKAGGAALFELLLELKAQGLVEKIGCSFYTRAQIEAVSGRYALDIMQVPINIFDQRLLDGNFLVNLQQQGLEVYARSIFLQGLIFLTPEVLPENIKKSGSESLLKLKELGEYYRLSALELALAFFKDLANINLVVGVTSLAELRQIHQAFNKIMDLTIDPEIFKSLACHDPILVNPSLWGQA